MVDTCGRWTAEKDYKDYPKNKWCDYDYIAYWIMGLDYKPKTSIENLVETIVKHYDDYLMYNETIFYTDIEESENGLMVSIKDVSCFVEDNGGLKEFDYFC